MKPLAGVPLRTQLLGLLLATTAVVVLAVGLVSTAALRSYLVERIDAQLVGTAQAAGGPGDDRHGPRHDVAVTTLQYDDGGQLLATSRREVDQDGGPDVASPDALPRTPVDVAGVGGDRHWRVLAADDGSGGTVVVAVPLDGVEATVGRLLVIDLAVGLLALAAAGLLALVAVRRSLRPLVDVEETAQRIAAGDLTVRVPAADPRTEVGSLASSFNAMVDRFQDAYLAQQASESEARASEDRMRRFVADASHELRTPLTSIRGFAELYRQGAASGPEQTGHVLRRIEDEAARMGLLVEDLLLLARLDQARPLRREPVDVALVAADVVAAAAAVHGGTHVLTLTGAGRPAAVLGDDARLHQVLSNLVGNAVAHTPPGTRVDVEVVHGDDDVRLEVRDDGPGLAPADAARVFERFFRADASRTRSGPATTGSGLGLSIVQALVVAHGGEVSCTSSPGSGTCFRVRVPALVGARQDALVG